MTKEDILKLHTYHEHQLWDTLWKAGILKHHHESIAGCAFRMRGEAPKFALGCKKLDEYLHKTEYQGGLSHGGSRWFLFGADPIHWIQAALLAKLETETR